MLKKAFAAGVLALTAASGALVTSSPAVAQTPTWRGCWGGCFSHHLRFFSHQRSFNFNRNALFNNIPISIRNQNNNIAINNQRQRQRQFQRERLFDFDDD